MIKDTLIDNLFDPDFQEDNISNENELEIIQKANLILILNRMENNE